MSLELRELRNTIPQNGRIEWIGLRPARREPLQTPDTANCTPSGLQGDRFSGPAGAKRTVTLIQHEHLAVIAGILGRDDLDPDLLRRNLVVSGINLISLKDLHFRVGEAILFGTGPCPPCSRMEENLGPGGYNAMRGHGGITARVIQPGQISIGSIVTNLGPELE